MEIKMRVRVKWIRQNEMRIENKNTNRSSSK